MDMPIMHDNDRYELVRDIGSDNFGIARLMRDKQSKELVVVKYIECGKKIDENIQYEIINHRSLRHPNIIRFKEYASGGEIFERICNAGRFSEDEARFFFQQLISGVGYFHSMTSVGSLRGVRESTSINESRSSCTWKLLKERMRLQGCHHNLKLENILLDGSTAPRLKICDFVYSKTKPSCCAKMDLHKDNSCCDVKDLKFMLSGPIESSLVGDEEHNTMVEAIEEALIVLESQESTLSVEPEKTSFVPPNLESITDVERMHATASSEEHHISGKLLDQFKSVKYYLSQGYIDIDVIHVDPQFCSLYAPDVYTNLRAAELIRRPLLDFMETVQQDITLSMRAVLIDWLVEARRPQLLLRPQATTSPPPAGPSLAASPPPAA